MLGLSRWALALGLGLAALVVARVAPAGEDEAPVGRAGFRDTTVQPLTLAPQALELSLGVELNLSRDHVAEPASLPLDVRYGLTESWTLALIHSHAALGEIGSGYGLCLTGTASGCATVYRALAVGARYGVARDERWEAAVDTAVGFREVDPFKPAWHLGATVRLRAGVFTAQLSPALRIGLAHVDEGNRAALEMPLWLRVQAGPFVAFGLRTGLRGEVRHFGEVYAVPLGAGVWVAPVDWLELGAAVAFPRALGPLNTPALRHLSVVVRVMVP